MTAVEHETPFVPVLTAEYAERRSRLTVAFRLILAIPHLILLYFGLLISIVLAVVGWGAAVILGRLPGPIANFLSQFVGYSTRVTAYVWFLTDLYPPFNLERSGWAVDVELSPARLNRLAVLFRIILMFPAYIIFAIVVTGLSAALIVVWLIELFTGRMPRALFDAMVAVLRYDMRFSAYALMVSSAYPTGLLGDGPEPLPPPMPPDRPLPSDVPAPPEAAPPPPAIPAAEDGAPLVTDRQSGRLVLSSFARRIVVVFIVLGVLVQVAQSAYLSATRGEFTLFVGFGSPPDVFRPLRARDAFFNANQSFGARVGTFQQTVEQCDSQPEPFRCAQDAERGLVSALVRFDSAVGRIDFPDELSSQVAAVRGASAAFRKAIEALIGADSEEEYFQLVPSLTERGNDFDSAVVALGTELDRLVEGA